jgi:hypothetical protein
MMDLIADIVLAVINRHGKAIKPLRILQAQSKDEQLAHNICRAVSSLNATPRV